MIDEDSLQERNTAMLPHLDERQRRLFAAAEARAAGHGGIAVNRRPKFARRITDATDVAMVTSFGPCTLASFKVITEEVALGAPANA